MKLYINKYKVYYPIKVYNPCVYSRRIDSIGKRKLHYIIILKVRSSKHLLLKTKTLIFLTGWNRLVISLKD